MTNSFPVSSLERAVFEYTKNLPCDWTGDTDVAIVRAFKAGWRAALEGQQSPEPRHIRRLGDPDADAAIVAKRAKTRVKKPVIDEDQVDSF